MSLQLTPGRRNRTTRVAWANAAFVVEAIVLLVFLIAALAVVVQMFAASLDRSQKSDDLTGAVAAATTAAERFAVDPASAPAVDHADGLLVTCDVTPVRHRNGTLYQAVISVYARGDAAAAATAIGNGTADAPGSGASGAGFDDGGGAVAAGPAPIYTITTSAYESEVSR